MLRVVGGGIWEPPEVFYVSLWNDKGTRNHLQHIESRGSIALTNRINLTHTRPWENVTMLEPKDDPLHLTINRFQIQA